MLSPQVDFVVVFPLEFRDVRIVGKAGLESGASISGDRVLHKSRVSDNRVLSVWSALTVGGPFAVQELGKEVVHKRFECR